MVSDSLYRGRRDPLPVHRPRPRAPHQAVVPEVSSRREFERRETWFGHYLPKATRVIVPAEVTRQQVGRFYGVLPENCLVLPVPTPTFACAPPTSREETLRSSAASESRSVHRVPRAVLAAQERCCGARRPGRATRTGVKRSYLRWSDPTRDSSGTVRNIITPLRGMLADAVRQGKLLATPAAGADLPPAQDFIGKEIPREHTDAIRHRSSRSLPPIHCETNEDLFYVHSFNVALGTGLRLGEPRALRWRDVDRDRRVIRVGRARTRGVRSNVRRPTHAFALFRSSPPSTMHCARLHRAPSSAGGSRRRARLCHRPRHLAARVELQPPLLAADARVPHVSRILAIGCMTSATRAFRVSSLRTPKSSSSRPSPATPAC